METFEESGKIVNGVRFGTRRPIFDTPMEQDSHSSALEPLVVAFAADVGVRHGLVVAVSSLLRHHRHRPVVIHLIDGGLPLRSLRHLRRLLRRHGKANLRLHPFEPGRFAHCRPGPNGSMMSYARILLGSLLRDEKRVLYFDTDILIRGRIDSLWSKDFADGSVIAGAIDPVVERLGRDSPIPLEEEDRDIPYINTGVLLLDLERWRAGGFEQACLELLNLHGGACTYWDQTAINSVCGRARAIVPLKGIWNHSPLVVAPPPPNEDVVVFHYFCFPICGERPDFGSSYKPWDWWSLRPEYCEWRGEARRAGVSPLLLLIRSPMRGQFLAGYLPRAAQRHRIFAILVRAALRFFVGITRDSPRQRTALRLVEQIEGARDSSTKK